MHIHMHIHTYTLIHMHTYARFYTHANPHAHMRTHTLTHSHTCTHIHTYTRAHTWTQVHGTRDFPGCGGLRMQSWCVFCLYHGTHVTRLIHMCDTTQSYAWHDSFKRVTWLLHMWHDSFTCATRSHSYVRHDLIHMCDTIAFICVTRTHV